MKVEELINFKKGWFVGHFCPTIYDTSTCECAIKKYKKGEKEECHYHMVATEITVIVSGYARMFGQVFGPGSVISIEPGEATAFEALSDVVTSVVKVPCVANDKFLGDRDCLNIVIPMAGRGSRFANAGYTLPKPLIDVCGQPMIHFATESVRPKCKHRLIYICLEEHIKKYNLEKVLCEGNPNAVIVPVSSVTEGAACTVLLAKKYIDNGNPLMIANSDQYLDVDIDDYLKSMGLKDGFIMTMPGEGPKWSYVKTDDKGLVTLVREKEQISNQATAGVYNFKYGSDFVAGAEQMIAKDIRVNNEFYVAPVYNELIEQNKQIGVYDIGDGMHGLGTPADLELFLSSDVAKKLQRKNEPNNRN